MREIEELVGEIERDLDAERCTAALPRLLELCDSDALGLTKVYLLAARCYFVARDSERCTQMLQLAHLKASNGPLEAQARVATIEASLLTTAANIPESEDKLAFVFEHLSEVSDELRSLAFSIRGRNEALSGRYAEAIEYSQEAISLGSPTASSVMFANGTIAWVFQVMGRIDESEEYGLEQIRLLTAKGSTNSVAGLYSFLSSGAASIKQWARAQEYEEKAIELIGATKGRSTLRIVSMILMAENQLELGNFDQALEYGLNGLTLAKEESFIAFELNAQILLGRVHLMKHEYAKALELLQVPLEREAELGDNQRMQLYRELAETYKALDRKAEAFDICWRLWELQTDFDARTREALLRYHRALEQKIHAQKTSILNMKANQMERELALTASQLSAQVDLLGRFRNELREIVRESASNDPTVKKVKDKLKDLPCTQIDWAHFESQFSTVHPDFKSKLEEKHPDLTRSEAKICSLTRLKLTGEEIARLLCLSPRSVETHRFNIRKKFGLKTEQNLGTYLASL